MSKVEHLQKVLYTEDISLHDRIILTTDQKQSCVFFYNNKKPNSFKKVTYFKYDNQINNAKEACLLSKQIEQIQTVVGFIQNPPTNTRKQPAYNNVFYLNSKYANVVSHPLMILTNEPLGRPSINKL